MRYDCITLGNHDFDYSWDYIYGQLEKSGMLKKTLVAVTCPCRSPVARTLKSIVSSGAGVSAVSSGAARAKPEAVEAVKSSSSAKISDNKMTYLVVILMQGNKNNSLQFRLRYSDIL